MNDDEFLAAFESAAIANTDFRHREHLRMAWLYVRRDGPVIGGRRIREGIRRFAVAHGVPHPELDRFEDVLGCYAGFEDRRLPGSPAAPVTPPLRPNGRETEETPWRIA